MFGRWSPTTGAQRARTRKQFEDESLHEELEERFRKTLYYGELPDDDCPSLPLSNLAVKFFQDVTPRGLGQVDLTQASSLAEDAFVSPGSLVTSMIYAKRLRNRNSDYLQKMSSSDLFFISVMMASKYMYDEGVDEEVFNDEWAEAANLDVDEVNQMEMEYLSAMDWQLFVSQSEFLKTVEAVERSLAWSQGCSRGWLSYTDVSVLWQSSLFTTMWADMLKDCSRVLTVGSAAYVAGVLTMVGSTALAVQLSTSMTGYLLISRPSLVPDVGPTPSLPASVVSNTSVFDDPAPGDMPAQIEIHAAETILNGNTTESETPHKTVSPTKGFLESVLSQLWAVATFKDRFVHLLCVLSQTCRTSHREHSFKKMPTRCQKTGADHQEEASDPSPSERLQPPKSSSHCQACPLYVKGKRYGKLPRQMDVFRGFDLVKVIPALKASLRGRDWTGGRPPDHLNLGLPSTPEVTRGFTTSVPVAA